MEIPSVIQLYVSPTFRSRLESNMSLRGETSAVKYVRKLVEEDAAATKENMDDDSKQKHTESFDTTPEGQVTLDEAIENVVI